MVARLTFYVVSSGKRSKVRDFSTMSINVIYLRVFPVAHAGVVNRGLYPDCGGDISVSSIVSVTNVDGEVHFEGETAP